MQGNANRTYHDDRPLKEKSKPEVVFAALQSGLTAVIKEMVDAPDKVEVVCQGQQEHSTVLISVHVSGDCYDLGKVIGKSGRNADALRTLAGCIAGKHGFRCVLEILE